MMTKFSDLTRGFNELTDKQYAQLRDAGFSPDFLSNKKQPFFQLHYSCLPLKEGEALKTRPTDQQIDFIRSQCFGELELDDDLASYADARYAIRTIAIEQDDDQRYIDFINSYSLDKKKKNDERIERRREQKMRKQEHQEESQQFVVNPTSEDWDEIEPVDNSDFLGKLTVMFKKNQEIEAD
jgi:hypothetical protein